MEQSRFFRFVWQVNSLLIMAGGLLAICVLSYVAFRAVKEEFRDRNVQNIVNIEKNGEVTETLSFGRIARIGDGPFVMVSLNLKQEYPQGHYSKSASSTRNWLFIDTKSNDRHWLIDGHKNLISDTEYLSVKSGPLSEDNTVKALMYTVIGSDTNNDGRLTDKDASNIAFSRPNGKDYSIVVEGMDHFLGHQMVDEKTVFILYKKSEKTYSRTVNLGDFSSSAESQLPE